MGQLGAAAQAWHARRQAKLDAYHGEYDELTDRMTNVAVASIKGEISHLDANKEYAAIYNRLGEIRKLCSKSLAYSIDKWLEIAGHE